MVEFVATNYSMIAPQFVFASLCENIDAEDMIIWWCGGVSTQGQKNTKGLGDAIVPLAVRPVVSKGQRKQEPSLGGVSTQGQKYQGALLVLVLVMQ